MVVLARHFGVTGQLLELEVGGLFGGQSCMHALRSSHSRPCRSSQALQGKRAVAAVVATVVTTSRHLLATVVTIATLRCHLLAAAPPLPLLLLPMTMTPLPPLPLLLPPSPPLPPPLPLTLTSLLLQTPLSPLPPPQLPLQLLPPQHLCRHCRHLPCGLMRLFSCLCAHQLMVWPHRQAIEFVLCQRQRYLPCMELLPDHLWAALSGCAGLSMRLVMSWLPRAGTWAMSQVDPRTVSFARVEMSCWLPSLLPTAMMTTGRECLHIMITICSLLSATRWTRGRQSGHGCF